MATTLQDNAYVGLGFAVRGVRQVNEAFEKLVEQFGASEQLEQLREQAEEARTRVTELVTPYVEWVQERVEQLIERLPEDAQKAYKDALELGKQVAGNWEQFARKTFEIDEQAAEAPKAKKVSAKVVA